MLQNHFKLSILYRDDSDILSVHSGICLSLLDNNMLGINKKLNLIAPLSDKISMILKNGFTILSLLAFASCAQMEVTREPSAQNSKSCVQLVKFFFTKRNTDDYAANLEKKLVDKKLLTFTNKFVTVGHPKMDWMNRARISLNKSIKNWNNNKYPAFYIFHDEDVVTHAKNYFETIHSIVNPNVKVAPDATKNMEMVQGWIKNFENYQVDIDNILDERISVQYNLSILKKLKIKEDIQDIKLLFKKDGKLVEEVITLRKSDKDLAYQIKRLKKEIDDLDGTIFRSGKIKERVMRQAMLTDALTIVHREFEYALKNTPNPDTELTKEFERLTTLLKNSDYKPTTYGVYRITNKIFIREFIALTKLDLAYKTFAEAPLAKFRQVIDAFIHNRPLTSSADKEKIGIFKKMYAKITNITPKQLAIGGAVLVAGGIGFDRYFALSGDAITQIENSSNGDPAHEEQMNQSIERDNRESEGHSSVIEIEIDQLTE